MKSFYSRKEILITGGTGTLGKEITKQLLRDYPDIRGIRIYSRDEEKHRLMEQELKTIFNKPIPISFLVGDIRDKTRLDRALNGVDLVFHTAAMKQIPHCEYNPIEAVRTNVEGSVNVIDCAIDNCVEKVMLISTDKACYPVNLYGATKATAEKLFIHANVYSGNFTKLSVCRYGNVLGSRGSVLPVFKEQYQKDKTISITDPNMTRFWIFIDEVAKFIIDRMEETKGGEIFIPEMLSMSIIDFAKMLYPDTNIKITGARQGEKLHECLLTMEESIYSHFIPVGSVRVIDFRKSYQKGEEVFIMTSDNTDRWIPEVFLGQIKKRGLI